MIKHHFSALYINMMTIGQVRLSPDEIDARPLHLRPQASDTSDPVRIAADAGLA